MRSRREESGSGVPTPNLGVSSPIRRLRRFSEIAGVRLYARRPRFRSVSKCQHSAHSRQQRFSTSEMNVDSPDSAPLPNLHRKVSQWIFSMHLLPASDMSDPDQVTRPRQESSARTEGPTTRPYPTPPVQSIKFRLLKRCISCGVHRPSDHFIETTINRSPPICRSCKKAFSALEQVEFRLRSRLRASSATYRCQRLVQAWAFGRRASIREPGSVRDVAS